MVQYEEFVGKVNERIPAGFPAEAQYAIQATLGTLGEYLSGSEAEAFGARLPAELQAQLASGNYAEAAKKFSAAEFRRRVAEREGLPVTADGGIPGQASTDAVLAVLSEVTGGTGFEILPPTLRPEPLPNA